MKYIENEIYKGLRFDSIAVEATEFDQCIFQSCNFEAADLTLFRFLDCTFIDCNLSNANLQQTSFTKVHFKACKMMGLVFADCKPLLLSFSFDACNLDLCSFFKLKHKAISFKQCSMREVDFTAVDFRQANFDECDLTNAVFENSQLTAADFRTSYNFIINPMFNQIKKAKFSTDGLIGLVQQFGIEVS